MIKKCDFKGCEKAGICRCPKDRTLKEYWHFCKDHAAEYNKNWNYYAGMSAEEINKEWEKDMFGTADGDAGGAGPEYQKLISDFLKNRKMPPRTRVPGDVVLAFRRLDIPTSSDWAKVQSKYRALAKQEHPDTNKSKDQRKFVEITAAYQTLKKFFNK